MADLGLTLTIGDEEYDLNDLTLGEVEELEDAFGRSISQIDLDSAKAMRYLVWFAKRRKDPAFTLEMAGSVQMSDLIPEEALEPNGGKPKKRPTKAKTA
jgi:hypothetical protein